MPREGFIKINFDESKSSHQTAGGYIICNWVGRFIQAVAVNVGATSILVIEATTIRNEIRNAVQVGYTDMPIEGDNKILIQVVLDHIQVSWEIQVLIQDIYSYFQSCNL